MDMRTVKSLHMERKKQGDMEHGATSWFSPVYVAAVGPMPSEHHLTTYASVQRKDSDFRPLKPRK